MASNGGKRGRGRPKKVVVEAEKQKMSLTNPIPAPQNVAVKAMDMTGRSIETAIDLTGESDIPMAVSRSLEKLFGIPLPGTEELQVPWPRDGNYFVKSESIHQNMKRTMKYKVVFIEDSHGKNHQIFFIIPQTRMA